jgi:hypothetical protein
LRWILQENIFNEPKWEELVSNLERFGIPHSVHKVVPFVGELHPDIDVPDGKVVCMGSYSMRHIARRKGWNPGVYDLAGVSFLDQFCAWGGMLLNAESRICSFGSLVLTEPTFVRPEDDTKSFAGKVFQPDEWNEWREKIVRDGKAYGYTVTEDTRVIASAPKEIHSEARYWIVNDHVATSSMYRQAGEVRYGPVIDAEFDWFVGGLTTKMSTNYWRPADAYCLDVCRTPNGMKVVEINTLNSAGYYDADMQKLVMAIEEMESRE